MDTGRRVALGAAIAKTILTAMKFALFAVTGSVALLGDAFHSFADIITSLLVFLSLSVGKQGTDGTGREGKLFQRIVAAAISVAMFFAAYSVIVRATSGTGLDIKYPAAGALVVVVLAAITLVIGRYERAVGISEGSIALVADGAHTLSDTMASTVVAVSLFGTALGATWMDSVGGFIVGLLIALQALEILFNLVHGYLVHGGTVEADEYHSRILLGIFRTDAVDKLLERVDKRFGWGLARRKWLHRLSNAFWPLCLVAVMGALAASMFYVVRPDEAVFRTRFGRVIGGVRREAGMHCKLPWPVESVDRLRPGEIFEVSTGYEKKSGDPEPAVFLWTREHYATEFEIVLNDGTEMLTAFVSVFFRADEEKLHDFAYRGAADVRKTVRAIASREILEAFSHRESFPSMTVRRDEIALEVRDGIQAQCDVLGLAVKVMKVAFRDIHPPVDIAPSFLAVLSAEEDRYSREYQAQREASLSISWYKSTAYERVRGAESTAAATTLAAQGESSLLNQLSQVHSKHDRAVRLNLYLDSLERSLGRSDCRKIVVDKPPDGEMEYWIGLMRAAAP